MGCPLLQILICAVENAILNFFIIVVLLSSVDYQKMSVDAGIVYSDYCLVHLFTYQTIADGDNVIYGLSQLATDIGSSEEAQIFGICSGPG
jgi:hypothetical protein